jgi:TonB-linked SusC/RagA family outer membrane protein
MVCGRLDQTVALARTLRWTRRLAASFAALGALATFGVPPAAFAQSATGTVTGRVTDAASGTPLANTTVRVVGTQLGGLTGEDGNYTLRGIPAGTVNVQFGRIGYEARSQSVALTAGQTATLNVTLTSAAFSLSAVVTTVTGQQRKVELANTTAQINLGDKIADLPTPTMGAVLSGRAAGVQVVNGGAVGAGSRVRIRGQSSLSLTSEPVVIIDGVRVTSSVASAATGGDQFGTGVGTGGAAPSRLDDINPEEIESIEIIKGPSAATLYGTEAANGVISITTKKGKSGKTRYNFYSENGISENSRPFPDMYSLWGKSAGQTASRICTLSQVLGGCVVDSLSRGNILTTDSLTSIARGNRSQYGMQVSGGTDRVQFFLSGETEGETGIYKMPRRDQLQLQTVRGLSSLPEEQIRPNALDRHSFRANVSAQLASKLFVQVASGYVNSEVRLPQNEDNSQGLMVNAMGATWRQDLRDPTGYPLLGARSWSMGEVFSQTTTQGINRFLNSLAAQYTPFGWLATRASVGYDFTGRVDKQYNRVNEGPYEGQVRLGNIANQRTELSQGTVDLGGTATWNVRSGIQAKTSLGMQFIRNLSVRTGATGVGLPPGALTVTAAATRSSSEATAEKRTLGFYAEEVLSFGDKLFITGGLRRDAASAFGDQFRAVYYPKLGASWLLSDQGFFPRPEWMNTLRLRATYGASGQIPGPSDALRYYQANPLTLSNGGDAPSVSLTAVGNPALKPEFSAETEAGFDLTLFNSRTNVEVTYYDKNTRDAIIQRQVAPSLAGLQTRFENIGNIQNKGLELVYNQKVVDRSSVAVDFMFTGSTNKNQMTKLAPGVSAIFTGNRNTQRNEPGYPLFGLWSQTYTYADANNDGILALSEMTFSDSATFVGATYPTREVAFSPSIELFNRKLRLSGQVDSKWGYKKFNNTLRHRCQGGASCRGLYDKSAPLEEQAAALAVNQRNVFYGMFEDGAFTRFREASVAYELPTSLAARVRASRLSLILTGRNLGVLTDYTGVDPEAAQSSNSDTRGNEEYFATPPLRYLTIRLNANF